MGPGTLEWCSSSSSDYLDRGLSRFPAPATVQGRPPSPLWKRRSARGLVMPRAPLSLRHHLAGVPILPGPQSIIPRFTLQGGTVWITPKAPEDGQLQHQAHDADPEEKVDTTGCSTRRLAGLGRHHSELAAGAFHA